MNTERKLDSTEWVRKVHNSCTLDGGFYRAALYATRYWRS